MAPIRGSIFLAVAGSLMLRKNHGCRMIPFEIISFSDRHTTKTAIRKVNIFKPQYLQKD